MISFSVALSLSLSHAHNINYWLFSYGLSEHHSLLLVIDSPADYGLIIYIDAKPCLGNCELDLCKLFLFLSEEPDWKDKDQILMTGWRQLGGVKKLDNLWSAGEVAS